MKSWFQGKKIKMYHTNNEGKSVAAKGFIRMFLKYK